jgi:ABC-type nitrate/sulfonate/bicarbonate transport system substrate-binding protein
LVLVTSRETLRDRPDALESALIDIAQGLDDTRAHPEEAVRRIAQAAETTDTELVRAQLDAVLPIFANDLEFDRDVLEQWADFDVEIGLVKERPDVSQAFDFTMAP